MKKVSCGRTKAEEIVKNVVQPLSREITLNEVSKVTSIASTDVSNKGSSDKLFPVALRYFLPEFDIRNRLIDFYEDYDERPATVSNQLE